MTHTDTHTHTQSYIPWIHKCFTKSVGCGTSHGYTFIHNFYSVKFHKHFTKQCYKSSLHIKDSATE